MPEAREPTGQATAASNAQPGLFVHIVKTAGISIRDALEERYNIVCDYGLHGPKTSKLIRKYKYKRRDPYALYHQLQDNSAWLVGHFNLHQFSDFVDCRRIITFVRHPVDRVISHFNHIRAYVSSDTRLEVFTSNEKARNEQHRVLKSMPLGCIGYVGITERFDESLEMINSGLQLGLELKYANINRHKTIEKDEVSAEMRAMIAENNPRDMALYERAVAQHELRYRLFSEGKPWCHGYYTLSGEGRLHGSAFYADSDEAVELEVVRNGEKLASLEANQFQPREVKSRLPRQRYVAFQAELSPPFEDLEVVVSATGQRLERHIVDR